jgi:hypothetical protein
MRSSTFSIWMGGRCTRECSPMTLPSRRGRRPGCARRQGLPRVQGSPRSPQTEPGRQAPGMSSGHPASSSSVTPSWLRMAGSARSSTERLVTRVRPTRRRTSKGRSRAGFSGGTAPPKRRARSASRTTRRTRRRGGSAPHRWRGPRTAVGRSLDGSGARRAAKGGGAGGVSSPLDRTQTLFDRIRRTRRRRRRPPRGGPARHRCRRARPAGVGHRVSGCAHGTTAPPRAGSGSH